MSIGKSFRNLTSRLSGKPPRSSRGSDPAVDYAGLIALWPDGTWDKPWGKSTMHEMDLVMRGILLDVWEHEQRVTLEETCGRKLNPGMFSADPIPMGWKPRLSSLQHSFKAINMDPGLQPWVIGKLKGMGRLTVN